MSPTRLFSVGLLSMSLCALGCEAPTLGSIHRSQSDESQGGSDTAVSEPDQGLIIDEMSSSNGGIAGESDSADRGDDEDLAGDIANGVAGERGDLDGDCLLYTSPSPRD